MSKPSESSVAPLSWDDARLLIESVADYAILMLDVDGRIVTWNRGAERISGYSAEAIVGEHFSRFYPQADIDAGKPELELKTARDFGRVEHEGFRVRKDGSLFWANVVVTALRDEAGRLRGFGTIARDVTQRREVERLARESEERFHLLVDNIADYAIFMLDLEGRVSSWNVGAQRTKGYEPNEILGRHFSVFYTPEDQAAGLPNHILNVVRQAGRFAAEGYRVRKDGSRFWANVTITLLRNREGTPIGFAKITRDLSERRAVEEQLRRSEERSRLLVENVTDYAIYMLDPDGFVSTWNVGAERMKGYRADEIVGRHFSVFFPAAAVELGKPDSELVLARSTGHFEEEGLRLRKDGSEFWARVVLTPIRNAAGELLGYAKVTRDLTARRQAEATQRSLAREQSARAAAESAELRLRQSEEAARQAARAAEEALRRAEETNRIKDEFLATVSHELRTPLTAILGWATLLQRRKVDASFAKASDAIYRNAVAQAKIIEDILDVSRIVTGKLLLEPTAVDLASIVNEALDTVRTSAAAKKISLELTSLDEPMMLAGDSERLRQIAWNLLANAVKFTEAGGRISITLLRETSSVTLKVQDTGSGIDPEFLPFVFDRFKQADSSKTRKHGGLGLGLAIVRHLVELHGGEVRAESPGKGHGSTFYVTLPVHALTPDVEPPDADTPQPEPASLRRKTPDALHNVRVLVVDDDGDARALLREVFLAAGAVVETASSAPSAFTTFRTFRPDLLVSDIGMPGEDGYSLIRRIRALPLADGGSVPAIALTAYVRQDDQSAAVDAGFTMHVGKPVDPGDLLTTASRLLGQPSA